MSWQGRRRTILVPALTVVALSACTMGPPPEPAHGQRATAQAKGPDRVPGEYIVTLKTGADDLSQEIRGAYSEFGVIRLAPIGSGRYLLKLERDPGPSVIEQRASRVPAIQSAQPNYIYRTQ